MNYQRPSFQLEAFSDYSDVHHPSCCTSFFFQPPLCCRVHLHPQFTLLQKTVPAQTPLPPPPDASLPLPLLPHPPPTSSPLHRYEHNNNSRPRKAYCVRHYHPRPTVRFWRYKQQLGVHTHVLPSQVLYPPLFLIFSSLYRSEGEITDQDISSTEFALRSVQNDLRERTAEVERRACEPVRLISCIFRRLLTDNLSRQTAAGYSAPSVAAMDVCPSFLFSEISLLNGILLQTSKNYEDCKPSNTK
jgi:hypothetical protein